MSTQIDNQIFCKKFNPKELGFFDINIFADGHLGFSAKKRLFEEDNNITELELYTSDAEYCEAKKGIFINATYGKMTEDGGIILRINPKIFDPIDLRDSNKYYYDPVNQNFLKGNKIINPNDILNDFYLKHIRPTMLFRGLYLRTKLYLLHKILKNFFNLLSWFFSKILKIISGEVYYYKFEDYLNDRFENKHSFKRKANPELKLVKITENPVNFLGYNATPQCILFYSIFHFLLFLIFYYKNFNPIIFQIIFKNAFLTLIYVMLSIIFIDKKLPKYLRWFIDFFSKKSFYFEYKQVNV